MARSIDYFFICLSPWAYLGHQEFHDLAMRHGVAINYRPVVLGEVWKASGSVPLAQRSHTRQQYRNIELQRVRDMRKLPLNLQPKFFPADGSLADRAAAALIEMGTNPSGFALRAHRGVWAEDQNIADRDTVAGWLSAEGHDADAVLTAAAGDAVTARLSENAAAAIAAGLIGVPGYVLDGEPFWGQDRLDHLEHALASGRAPFRP